MPLDTEASKPSSPKPRPAAPRNTSVDVEARAAAPAKKAAASAGDAKRKAASRGDTKTRSRRSNAAAPTTAVRLAGRAQAFDQDLRRALIARAAYFRAERRGFAAGGEEQDWLEAEAEVDASLADGEPRAANDG